jgi:hypothetical protein
LLAVVHVLFDDGSQHDDAWIEYRQSSSEGFILLSLAKISD